MENIKELMARNINHGIVDITLENWESFNNLFNQIIDYPHYVWRGQKDASWVLEPTLNRIIKDIEGDLDNIIKKHLENFKYATRGRRGSNPKLDLTDDEWWALGQHNGLATPFLDWTTSPFVAAFFAFSEENSDEVEYRSIYALHQTRTIKKSNELKDKHKEVIEFIKPFTDDNPRLVNQSGLFSKGPVSQDLEKWIAAQFIDDKRSVVLIKIRIPTTERLTFLKALNRMNINHLTLFPDIIGSSIYSNMALRIAKYLG
jgi:hypothetical protein